MFIFERRLAAVQHTGSSRERLTPRGQRRFPALVLERRAARHFFRPSAIAFAELSTTAKPRTVGQFARSLRRSRVFDLSRARAARPVSIRRVARTNRVHWASRANACVQPGSCRAANADLV